MYILGVSYGYTASAILLKDGQVVAGASEERFNNLKNYNGFPKTSIDYCLTQAGISGSDLDLVATPYLNLPPSHLSDPLQAVRPQVNPLGLLDQFRQTFRGLRYRYPALRPLGQAGHRLATYIFGRRFTRLQRQHLAQYLGLDISRVVPFDHHLSHATSAYYSSPFSRQRALVMTLDGEGDNLSGLVYVFDHTTWRNLARIPREDSLGYVYGHVTQFLGMKPHEHEYKVMGLAPYAKESDVQKVYSRILDLITISPSDPLKFHLKFNAQDTGIYLKDQHVYTRFDHLAGAFQKLLEDKISQWVKSVINNTQIHTVVLSGGVFMNIKVNQVIAALPQVKRFYVLPSCADETAPLGSAYLGFLKLGGTKISPLTNLYWGPQFSDSQISVALTKFRRRLSIKKIPQIAKTIARLLAQKHIVAICSGRMEFGARALGNRSILAHPQDPAVIRVINDQVKNRDFWMPFAPSILDTDAPRYMVNPKDIPAPYMILGFNSTPLARRHLKAALHPADDSLRPQVLSPDHNPRYYKILTEFKKLTGIGGVLNTSFNLHGFPIILGPAQALEAFMNSGLEYLVLNNFLVTKKSLSK